MMANSSSDKLIRRCLEVRGRVQGVGFRPYVYRLAMRYSLTGVVGNSPRGVQIEIQGPAEPLSRFQETLRNELPPLARITQLRIDAMEPIPAERGFRIETSAQAGTQDAEITPDLATCHDCLAELMNPADRRYRYPFINCTNCGPRYSIITAVPYDRPNTTMSTFTMCPACQAEYDDPTNRRFHAQPNACPVCGPRLWLTDADGREVAGDAIRECAERLRAGQIVAVKGIGGFHLACRADEEGVVARLRARKSRESKPLAVMVADVAMAAELAWVDAVAVELLTNAQRPIVLLPARQKGQGRVCDGVAPHSDTVGLMLPYTPIHHLLFAEGLGPLVMTSGNPSDEPLCCDNDEAFARLSPIAEAFLLHNRPIHRRVDDSVILAVPDDPVASKNPAHLIATSHHRTVPLSKTTSIPIRRARGTAPEPIHLAEPSPAPILAVGGEMKGSVCILAGSDAVLSEHLGELSNPAAYRNFVQTVEQFKQLLRVEPTVVAYDRHPDYAATRYAQSLTNLQPISIQHHHAHIVSVMAEANLTGRVIGLACDGAGLGTDDAIWGCEVLACDETEFERLSHLRYFPLLGGDAAARQTWRPAVGLLWETYGPTWREAASQMMQSVEAEALNLAQQRLQTGSRLSQTSSLGRLFDAVAFLLGICSYNRHEAEAAMALETAAHRAKAPEEWIERACTLCETTGNSMREIDFRPLIRTMVDGVRQGIATEVLARVFHEAMARLLAQQVIAAWKRTGLLRVACSGGCFANRLLLRLLNDELAGSGIEVFTHHRVPTTDGGIALGQAVIAAAKLRKAMNRSVIEAS